MAHYIEGEMREAYGETRGCLGWAKYRMKRVRGHLKGLHTTLEAARKRWCTEENAIEAKRAQITEEMVAKVLKCEERRKAFEARWNEIKARNKRALDEGSFEGPIVPIGLRSPESPRHRRSRNEAKTERTSVLRVLDEEPEGVPKAWKCASTASGEGAPPPVPPPPEEPASEAAEQGAPPAGEGGASGSSDGAPPPLPPPVEDPASEAAEQGAPPAGEGGSSGSGGGDVPLPLEASMSKAGEVKKKIAEATVRLDPQTYKELEDAFIAAAKPEDLREQDREAYEAVRGVGIGVCSRCRFSYGCQSCDEAKAWSFACRSTLWHTSSEALRPKAKPRGRPKQEA